MQELNLESVNVLERLIEEGVAAGQYAFAQQALSVAAPRFFDIDSYQRLTELVSDAQAAQIRQASLRQRELVKARFAQELEALLGGGCLRLQLDALRRDAAGLKASYPGFAGRVDEGVTTTVAQCIVQLGETDFERAQALRDDAVSAFGAVGALADVRLDPCARSYLVDNGGQPGRGGYCVDEFLEPVAQGRDQPLTVGPRLIVVTVDGGRVAIGKHEVSWAQINPFCVATARCQPRDDLSLPVSGVDVATVERYLAWLSSMTGFSYRLPTLAQWRAAAAGEVDANRNCRVNAGGVERGGKAQAVTLGKANAAGAVNVHGNVQEWVRGDAGLLAVGGSYEDPIAQCVGETLRSHDGSADGSTGFRVARLLP